MIRQCPSVGNRPQVGEFQHQQLYSAPLEMNPCLGAVAAPFAPAHHAPAALQVGCVFLVIAGFEAIAGRRGVTITAAKTHDAPSVPCAPWLADQIRDAIEGEGHALRSLPSGAGHDGMAVGAIADIAMIFVRCRDGISHNPAEAITAEDAETGARVLARFIRNFIPRSLS